MRPWRAPRVWRGDTCWILGGGPSLLDFDLTLLQRHRTIAVNNAYKVAPWADAMIFGDCRWYPDHGRGLGSFAGLKVTTCCTWEREPGIRIMHKELAPYGISEELGTLRWNLSTGACALNLAFHLGASRIVLAGFDMHKGSDGRKNFHDDYGPFTGRDPFRRFLLPFPAIKADLDRLGVEVINATPGSALTLWPIADPAELVSGGPWRDLRDLPGDAGAGAGARSAEGSAGEPGDDPECVPTTVSRDTLVSLCHEIEPGLRPEGWVE
jgi:hypothetical protein